MFSPCITNAVPTFRDDKQTLRHKPKIRTGRSKTSVDNFLSGLSPHQTQKTEQDDTSAVAAPTTLNAPALSAVFAISKYRGWSIDCYGLTMATLLYAAQIG